MTVSKPCYKAPFLILALALICCVIVASISITASERALIAETEARLTALLESRKNFLSKYMDSIREDIESVSSNKQTAQAMQEFAEAWNLLEKGQDKQLQRLYITDNPHALGAKEEMDHAGDDSFYSQVHQRHHPWFRLFLRARGYYDIFLIDLNGDLVYTVYKELDYATNLNTGQFRDTGLGRAFRAAVDPQAAQGDQFFFDFSPYMPSHRSPASFMSTPIYNDAGEKIGVLVFQMSIDRLNGVASSHIGMGETGEIYMVGGDMLMRTNSRFSEESTILTVKVETVAAKKAISGEKGFDLIDDYRGIPVFSAYEAFDFMGTRWAILSEQDKKEVIVRVKQMKSEIICYTMIVMVLLSICGAFFLRCMWKRNSQFEYISK